MNFSCNSVKPKSKLHNEDFYFDMGTPRGHFFAVLDFASHDYANLNATLEGKLETIVGSFASLSDFSDDLFLGFLATEITNFVSNLAEQSGGPELFFSAALCLLSGNRLSYFLCGDVRGALLNSRGLVPLQASRLQTKLGVRNLEVPLTDEIQALTLRNADFVLIRTQGIADLSPAEMTTLLESDPKSICDLLIESSVAGGEDRTVLVIGGPYGQPVDAPLSQSNALAELRTSLASLDAKLDSLTQRQERETFDVGHSESSSAAELEQKFTRQLETFKDDLRSKAASIDLLEFEEKLKALNALLASKADNADLLGLQRDVLKLGLSTKRLGSTDANVASADNTASAAASRVENIEASHGSAGKALVAGQPAPKSTSFSYTGALIVVVISLAAGLAGGWIYSRATRKSSEVWTVKSSGNQLVISRLDGPAREAVTMNVAEPVKSSGEQTFSSFADVKRYLDTITSTASSPAQTSAGNQSTSPTDSKPTEIVSEIEFKDGDTLKKLAKAYKVPPRK